MLQQLGKFGYLLWEVILNLRYSVKDRRRILQQLEEVGVNSIPLVLLVGVFAGAIIAWQAAYQFQGLVSLTVLGGQVVRVVMMEMAPVLTALVICGRIGASMAAELGTMKVTEQVDALHTLSIDPVRFLVLPRFLGLGLMMPILVLFATMISVLGAYMVSNAFLEITGQVFMASIRSFFNPADLAGGLVKGVIFGMQIALISCYFGLETKGGAIGVGKSTIKAFVFSAISILAGDFLLWIILF